ncbi:MAG: replication initiator protein A [Acidobacteriota bacterium]|nr:replication initiator protein A [Blastocatellia bacterium]MDW8240712.1 replication initiator protein A [Acidobacteriota bacterium]
MPTSEKRKRTQRTKLKKAPRTTKETSDLPLFPEVLRQGKDEMNLATFPMAALYTHVPSGARSLKFEDTIIGKNGKLVKRTWTIQGGSEAGLPTATDEDVYVALMELTQRQGFDKQQVLFSRYDLLKRLGWCICGKCYARLDESLVRLSNVTFHARNAFWDNEAKSYVTAAFTLIQGYHIYEEVTGRKTERDQPHSWIMWSDQLYKSFKSGYLKFLDTNLYFSLRTSTARRLYRYLDRHFGRNDRFTIDIFQLAHEHLGISRNFQFISEIVRKLEPALEELVEKSYLASWEVKGRTIGFLRSPHARHEPFDTTAEDFPETIDLPFDAVRVVDENLEERVEEQAEWLTKQLVERGVTPREAKKLVESHWGEFGKIRLAVEYFDSLMEQGGVGIKNPGGFLVSLIREGNSLAAAQQAPAAKHDAKLQLLLDEMMYNEYIEQQVDQYIASLPAGQMAMLVEAKKQEFLASDKSSTYRRWKKEVFDEYATVFCRKDIAMRLGLPDFATWQARRSAS